MKPYIRKVNYYECDRMGVVHHSNYVRYMEEARIDLQEQLGYGFEKMEADGLVSPVISVEVEYKATTTFPDIIEISVSLVEMSALKLKFAYEMKVGGHLVCKASSTHCFLEDGRPVVYAGRYPEFTRRLIEEAGTDALKEGLK